MDSNQRTVGGISFNLSQAVIWGELIYRMKYVSRSSENRHREM